MGDKPPPISVRRSWLVQLQRACASFGFMGAVLGFIAGQAVTTELLVLVDWVAGGVTPTVANLCVWNVALWVAIGAALGVWLSIRMDRDSELAPTPDPVRAPAPSSTAITGRRPQGRPE
jgi:hypothetical protein